MTYVTPDLSDDFPELVQAAEPMFRNFGGRSSFGGQIVTVKCFEDNSVSRKLADEDGRGKVLVIDGGGSKRCALMGDMLAEKHAKNGWEGIIVYGCVRDVDRIAELDLGVQALAAHPFKSEKHNVGQFQVPVTFAGVTFRPGEYVYADNNGILISPQPLVSE